MGRAIRLVPALVAISLATAPAALAATGAPTSTVPVTTTTVAATPTAHCGATLGTGARWLRATSPCEVALTRGAAARITLTTHFRWGPLSTTSAHLSVATLSHPDTGGLTGTLRGRSLGAGTVTAIAAAVCPSGIACPMFVMLWTLDVKVVAPTSASVTVTQSDSGHTVTLSRGQRLVVALAGPSAYTWTTPAAADAAVLARMTGSAGHAVFASVGAGSTTVRAVDNPNCYPECLPPSLLFSVTVVVR